MHKLSRIAQYGRKEDVMKRIGVYMLFAFSLITVILLGSSLSWAQAQATVLATGSPLVDPVAVAVSPDGNTLYITDYSYNLVPYPPVYPQGVGGGIFTLPAMGGTPTPLASTNGGETSPIIPYPFDDPRDIVISKDGKTLYFTSYVSIDNWYSMCGYWGQIVKLPINPLGEPTILAQGSCYPLWIPSGLAISPDESTLYIADNYAGTILSIPEAGVPPNGSPSVLASGFPLSNNLWGPTDITVSPDGGTLFFVSGISSGGFGIFSLPKTGGTPTQILSTPSLIYPITLTISADGQTLFIYEIGGPNAPAIYSLPIKGGAPTLVFSGSPLIGGGYLTLSPDGAALFVADTGVSDRYGPGGPGSVIKLSLGPQNHCPTANAGNNLTIIGEGQKTTIIMGAATDPDGDSLTYRWLEEGTELITSQSVGTNGECPLDLSSLPYFFLGTHYLTLEVTDGKCTSTDEMILTVDNSAPHPAATGGGTYEISSPVILGGQTSDFDGDSVFYVWWKGETKLFSGQVDTIYGGEPANLPKKTLPNLSLGDHTISLCVNDEFNANAPVCQDIMVRIIDITAPTLSLVPDKAILWPPNHKMVNVTIQANAIDNSGGPMSLTAIVTSNEPEDGLGDGDMSPDWTEPMVDQTTGVITLQLRAERSGRGNGRTYTITVIAEDDSGNSSQANVNIIVPHDQRKK